MGREGKWGGREGGKVGRREGKWGGGRREGKWGGRGDREAGG